VAGLPEFRPNDDITVAMRVITRKGSNRVAREAFEIARTRARKKVTAAHKEPVYRLACGMFAEECRKGARGDPGVTFEGMMIDSISMKLVTAPQQFDVVVTTNQFGDILTDIGAGLVGGAGLAPGLCGGERQAMAQATHGSAPDIAGRNIANPYAMITSGQMLLAWLGRKRNAPKASAAAERIQAAVKTVIAGRKHLTRDLGGQASTPDIGGATARAVQGEMRQAAPEQPALHREDDHAHSSRQARRDARARNRLAGGGVGASAGPELAAAVDQDDRAVPGGRRHRLHRAPCRQAPLRAVGPAGVRREPRRRQRRHRPAGADAIRSRRLHDLGLLRHAAGGQPIALREASLRAAARLRPGGHHGAVSGNAGCAPVGARAFGVGANRARQVEARGAGLRLRRGRELQPSGDGAVFPGHRREAFACAVQRQRPAPGSSWRVSTISDACTLRTDVASAWCPIALTERARWPSQWPQPNFAPPSPRSTS